MLIDTHCHLDDDQLKNAWPEVLQAAKAAGVTDIVAVAVDAASSKNLAERFRPGGIPSDPVRVHPTAGIHPNHAAKEPHGAWEAVAGLLRGKRAVAVGETGLDQHWHDTPFEMQEDYFARHLDLARELDLPVIIHCRDCVEEMVAFLKTQWALKGPVRGVMHSFSGDTAFADVCLELGLMLSFSGVLTYKNAQALRDVAGRLPHNRVMVETDAPYLAPVPKRGKRNEPAFVAFTAMELARLWSKNAGEVMEITARNAGKLFGLTR